MPHAPLERCIQELDDLEQSRVGRIAAAAFEALQETPLHADRRSKPQMPGIETDILGWQA